MNITIGANIKRLRMAKNLTQEQLAEAMHITCAAVSKWERGDTFPDITMLQPLAYYFDVTLDELMGYNREKIQKSIDDIIELYKKYKNSDNTKAYEIISKAYHDYPNNYLIMHYYMWHLAGDMADNDPQMILTHKDELLAICDKILDGCKEGVLCLNAWNMRAKIFHAEGKTEEALEIYKTKFVDWYNTSEHKTEQLFSKESNEYYYFVQKNMYELFDLAADKLGRTVFFDEYLSIKEKVDKTIKYGELLMSAFIESKDPFFLVIAKSFLGRIENDLVYRGGSEADVITVMTKNLQATKMLAECMEENKALFDSRRHSDTGEDILKLNINHRLNAEGGKRAELLKNDKYITVLNSYK